MHLKVSFFIEFALLDSNLTVAQQIAGIAFAENWIEKNLYC